jgi:LDH2 family malate/lactate/ureidoglycolate dehydrogenase
MGRAWRTSLTGPGRLSTLDEVALRPRSFRALRTPSRPSPVAQPAQGIAIPEQSLLRIPVDELITFATRVFTANDVPPIRARVAAEAICHGDLTGNPRIGLAGLARTFLPLFESGQIRPRAEPLVIADRGAAALVDCRRALGLWAVSDAMDSAVLRAGRYGVGLVSLRGVHAFGRAGHHAARALPHGMIGLVLATGGERNSTRDGVNPLGMAAPGGAYPAFVFDLDAAALDGPAPVTAGLMLLVEVFAGLLSGVEDHDHDTGLLVMAIAPTALRSTDGFYRAASALFGSLLGWDDGMPIRYPGWKEAEHLEQCQALGVPVGIHLYRELAEIAQDLDLPMPAVVQ